MTITVKSNQIKFIHSNKHINLHVHGSLFIHAVRMMLVQQMRVLCYISEGIIVFTLNVRLLVQYVSRRVVM